MGTRLSQGYTPIVAVLTSTPVWLTSAGAKAVIKKIMWMNRTAGVGVLRIGYLTLAAAFVPVMPDIYMVVGIDGELTENELPICGNARDGFIADTTPLTGTLGYIIAQTTCAAAAAPNDVQVLIEVEEE